MHFIFLQTVFVCLIDITMEVLVHSLSDSGKEPVCELSRAAGVSLNSIVRFAVSR